MNFHGTYGWAIPDPASILNVAMLKERRSYRDGARSRGCADCAHFVPWPCCSEGNDGCGCKGLHGCAVGAFVSWAYDDHETRNPVGGGWWQATMDSRVGCPSWELNKEAAASGEVLCPGCFEWHPKLVKAHDLEGCLSCMVEWVHGDYECEACNGYGHVSIMSPVDGSERPWPCRGCNGTGSIEIPVPELGIEPGVMWRVIETSVKQGRCVELETRSRVFAYKHCAEINDYHNTSKDYVYTVEKVE